jgi:hypothetical protein
MSDQEGEGASVSAPAQRQRPTNSASTLVDMVDQEAAAAADERAFYLNAENTFNPRLISLVCLQAPGDPLVVKNRCNHMRCSI